MRALVTGATGFLGSHLVDRLLEEGHEVHTLIRRSSNLRWLMGKKIQYHYGDVRSDISGLDEAIQNVDWIFHVAGVISSLSPATYYEVNAQGTANLLASCLKASHLKKIVVVTSLAAHGPSQGEKKATEESECHPITDYGRSKRDAELITLKFSDRLPVVVIRPPAIYGPRDDQILQIFRMIQKRLALVPHWGKGILNMAHVADVVSGLILAAQSPQAAGHSFFIGEDRNYMWKEAMQIMGQALGRNPLIVPLPSLLVYGSAGLTEAIGRLAKKMPSWNLDQAKNFLQSNWSLDISKARKLLGYQPRFSLKKGAEQTVHWYKNEGWL